MKVDYKNMPEADLVDLLAQKAKKFTHLMMHKNFDEEYKECKSIIQEVLIEIERRKEIASKIPEDQNPAAKCES